MERESFTLEVKIIAPFLFWKREKKVVVEYRQCNIRELFGFIEDMETGVETAKRVVDFIEKHTEQSLNDNDKSSIYIQSGTIFNVLYDTYFKGCFRGDGKDKKKSARNTDLSPIQANIAFIAKETCTSILDLYKMCTIQDIEYLMEGVVRNINSQSKEGQKRNQMRILQRKAERRSEEEIKEIEAKLARIPD